MVAHKYGVAEPRSTLAEFKLASSSLQGRNAEKSLCTSDPRGSSSPDIGTPYSVHDSMLTT